MLVTEDLYVTAIPTVDVHCRRTPLSNHDPAGTAAYSLGIGWLVIECCVVCDLSYNIKY